MMGQGLCDNTCRSLRQTACGSFSQRPVGTLPSSLQVASGKTHKHLLQYLWVYFEDTTCRPNHLIYCGLSEPISCRASCSSTCRSSLKSTYSSLLINYL